MTRETFNAGFAALIAVFPNYDRITTAAQDVYFHILEGIPDDLFEYGVKKCLAENNFFPTPHELGVACCGETKEEIVTIEDPWAFNQFRKQKIQAITWEQNLQKRLRLRKLIVEGPDKPKLDELVSTVLESPIKKTAAELERELQKLQAKYDELDRRYESLLQENFRLKRENDALREKPRQTVEERKAQLKEQMKILEGQQNGNDPSQDGNESRCGATDRHVD